jgi:hypothetical protein
MSLASITALPTRTRVLWATVDTGFCVGSRDGDYIGSVTETEAGAFIAHDGTSTPLGRYDSLEAARAAVEGWEPAPVRAQRAERERVLLPVATLAAVIAGGTALMAGTIVPFL